MHAAVPVEEEEVELAVLTQNDNAGGAGANTDNRISEATINVSHTAKDLITDTAASSSSSSVLGCCHCKSDVKPFRVRATQRARCCPLCCANFCECFEVARWKINLLLLHNPFGGCAKWSWMARITVSDIVFILIYVVIQIIRFYSWKDDIEQETDGWNKLKQISRAFAFEATGNYAIGITLAQRNTIWSLICGLPFERAIKYHVWVIRFGMLETTVHYWTMIAYWLSINTDEPKFQLQLQTNIAGMVAYLCVNGMGFFGLEFIRRRYWELFLKAHMVLLAVFIWAALKHNMHGIAQNKGLQFAGVIWLVDLLYRAYLAFSCTTRASLRKLELLDGGVIYLEFDKKNFIYDGGQYAFVCIPAVDITEWHPFSLSSVSSDGINHFHIKVSGDWCERVRYLIENNGTLDLSKLQLFVEGPYGRPEVPIHEYESLILVSGGIGITPMHSIFKDIMHQVHSGSRSVFRNLKRIHFVWTFRQHALIPEFDVRYRNAIFRGTEHERAMGSIESSQQFNYERFRLTIDDSADGGSTHDEEAERAETQTQTYVIEIKTSYFCSMLKNDPRLFEDCRCSYPGIRCERPNINDIILEAKEQIGSGSIAILGCGPARMLDDVRTFAARNRIHYHTEVFNF